MAARRGATRRADETPRERPPPTPEDPRQHEPVRDPPARPDEEEPRRAGGGERLPAEESGKALPKTG